MGGISVLVGQYELAGPGKLTCGPRATRAGGKAGRSRKGKIRVGDLRLVMMIALFAKARVESLASLA
jgi:hypothetical protein